jgi:mannose-6-phosphate isomerase-like protein (cupin superfamily)
MPTDRKFFDIAALARTLPETAETMLTDIRLTDEHAASCRIFRVYRAVPAHFHTIADEYLYVLSGRARIAIADDAPREVAPGELIFFRKTIVHALPEILEHPFNVLAIDTPRRPPEDIHFVNPADGTPETFIKTQY